MLLNEVEIIGDAIEAEEGHEVPVDTVLAELQELSPRYRKMKFEILKKNYYVAKRHHRKSTKRPPK